MSGLLRSGGRGEEGREGASARNLWREQNPSSPGREKRALSIPVMSRRAPGKGHRGLGLAESLEVIEMKMWPLEIGVCTTRPLWGSVLRVDT